MNHRRLGTLPQFAIPSELPALSAPREALRTVDPAINLGMHTLSKRTRVLSPSLAESSSKRFLIGPTTLISTQRRPPPVLYYRNLCASQRETDHISISPPPTEYRTETGFHRSIRTLHRRRRTQPRRTASSKACRTSFLSGTTKGST